MKLHKLTYTQARKFSGFVLPGVMDEPDAESFWYLSASDETKGMLGMAVIRPEKPVPELLSIGVADGECGQGIGSELVELAAQLLEEAGAGALRAAYSGSEEEWRQLDSFLRLNGFWQTQEETYTYNAVLGDILKQQLLQAQDKSALRFIKPISGLSDRILRAFRDEASSRWLFDPSVFDECMPEYSVAWVADEKIKGLFLVGATDDGQLHNVWTWIDPKTSNPKLLQQLFASAARLVSKDFAPDTVVNFPCLTPASDRLLRSLVPSAKKSAVMREYICPIGVSGKGSEDMKDMAENEAVEETAADAGESTFDDRQADFSGVLLGNDSLCCARCMYCKEDSVDSCAKYRQKPGTVYYGGTCPMLKEKEA